MKYYIGIDIGTSSAKVILMDEAGKIMQTQSESYQINEPKPGWKEIHPEMWMNAVCRCLELILKDVDAKKVSTIGVTGQMHTVIFLDKKGNSIRPALMWNDTRTASMVDKVKAKIATLDEGSHVANIISTGSPAMNLLWLKEEEPEQFQKIHKFLIGPDYIVFRLTGKYQTDYCDASTSSLCNLKTKTWSEEIRQLLGFSRDIYPTIRGTRQIAGELLDVWKKKYHFSEDVKVLVGTGDNPAAAISTGCFAKKYPVLSLGTSGVLMFPKEEIDFKAKGKNILFSLDGKEISYLVQGVVQSCGSSLSWWIQQILNSNDFDKETGNVDLEKCEENQLLFYPHLVGDKTIYGDANLRGGFFGIGTETTREEMTLAIMEGICFAIRELMEAMNLSKERMNGLKVTGGGSKNVIWMQMLADILDISVEQLESETGAGYGIALVAASADGKSMEQIVNQTVSLKETFYPRNIFVKRYKEKYKQYQKIHAAIQSIYHSNTKVGGLYENM